MAFAKYGVIYIGSYDTCLKIYQITSDKKIKVLEDIKQIMELGKETYSNSRLSFHTIDNLCNLLLKYSSVLKEYKITDFDVVASSAVREAKNAEVVVDRIRVKTGFKVRILSNSEERLLDFKSLFFFDEQRREYLKNDAAHIDLGFGSLQISIIEDGTLQATQNLRLGSMRIRELLFDISDNITHFDCLIEELINNDWHTFKKMFLKDKELESIVATGGLISLFARRLNNGRQNIMLDVQRFREECNKLSRQKGTSIMEEYNLTAEQTAMLVPTIRIYEKIINDTRAKKIWIPCTSLADGMVMEYAIKHKRLSVEHDFKEDILNTARSISKRYKASQPHISKIRELSLSIFTATKKIHGLGEREKLLLEVAAILHDCGKYISITSSPQCSYNIIMATEILGLTHKEREMVALTVMYNTVELENTDNLDLVKMVAILRMANALDRSHKQKFENCRIELKDGEMIIHVKTNEDITLEKGLLREKADFFEEVLGVRPVLKQKKMV